MVIVWARQGAHLLLANRSLYDISWCFGNRTQRCPLSTCRNFQFSVLGNPSLHMIPQWWLKLKARGPKSALRRDDLFKCDCMLKQYFLCGVKLEIGEKAEANFQSRQLVLAHTANFGKSPVSITSRSCQSALWPTLSMRSNLRKVFQCLHSHT